MKLADRMDAALIHQMLGAMTVGMKGEVFAALALSDLGCEVENANSATRQKSCSPSEVNHHRLQRIIYRRKRFP